MSGGGTKLDGFAEHIKDKLKLPVKKISAYEFDGAVQKMEDPAFAVAAGLVLWGMEKEFNENEGKFFEGFASNKAANKIKNWMKIFLP